MGCVLRCNAERCEPPPAPSPGALAVRRLPCHRLQLPPRPSCRPWYKLMLRGGAVTMGACAFGSPAQPVPLWWSALTALHCLSQTQRHDPHPLPPPPLPPSPPPLSLLASSIELAAGTMSSTGAGAGASAGDSKDFATSKGIFVGRPVWVPNPYPEADGAYRRDWLPVHASGRPLVVPGTFTHLGLHGPGRPVTKGWAGREGGGVPPHLGETGALDTVVFFLCIGWCPSRRPCVGPAPCPCC